MLLPRQALEIVKSVRVVCFEMEFWIVFVLAIDIVFSFFAGKADKLAPGGNTLANESFNKCGKQSPQSKAHQWV